MTEPTGEDERVVAGTGAREQYLQVRDHTTVASLYGADDPGAETVVLAHPALLDRRTWAEFAPALLAELGAGGGASGYRVIAYDVRGHGSAAQAPAITGIDQLADDAAAIFDAMDLGAAHLCGLSMGGALAQEFAVRYADRVRSLTLIATDLSFPRDLMDARAESFTAEQRDETTQATLHRWFGAQALTHTTPSMRYAHDCLRKTPPRHWSATWRALGRFDVSKRVSAVHVPVLAVSGAQDPATPPQRLEAVAGAYRRGRHVCIDPGPHLLALERSDELAAQVARFLRDIG